MKKHTLFLTVLLLVFLLITCKKKSTEPTPPENITPGTLSVSFYLNELWDPTPTRQTVIWLEDTDGNFVRSLFVSAWLAYGGYSHTEVCPLWNAKADWGNVDKEEFDAVAQATPDWGATTIETFSLDSLEVEVGEYLCRIETHIKDEYNISYTGTIEVAKENNTVSPEPVYSPSEHEQAGALLNSVEMIYEYPGN